MPFDVSGEKVARAKSSPDRHEVFLTQDAEDDLSGIYEYIRKHDSEEKADYVLERIEALLQSLQTFPERGAYPAELSALGIREYRQTYFKPYRMVYRVIGNRVYVYLIADGRRDMRAMLERRFLGTERKR